VSRIDDLLAAGFKTLGPKPPDTANREQKQAYSQSMSAAVALALAEEFRQRGMKDVRPAPPGVLGKSGAERRIAGGLGPKKVDVSWATEESGLLLGVSVKTINFRDRKTNNFQKNLINRRGDMLIEAVTLHRRFPYAILAGLLIRDEQAARDHTQRRNSTFHNAYARLKIFSGRDDPAGRDEQFERLIVMLVDANPFNPNFTAYDVGSSGLAQVPLDQAFDELISVVATRNPDTYEITNDVLTRIPGG
jgi:hypothetical protein